MRPILGVFWCRGRVRVRAGGGWALVLQFNGLGLVPGCFFGLSPASWCHTAGMTRWPPPGTGQNLRGRMLQINLQKGKARGGSGTGRSCNTQTFRDGRCNYFRVSSNRKKRMLQSDERVQKSQGNRRKGSGMVCRLTRARCWRIRASGDKCATWNRNVSG